MLERKSGVKMGTMKSRYGGTREGITVIIRSKQETERKIVTKEIQKALRRSKRLLNKELEYEIISNF